MFQDRCKGLVFANYSNISSMARTWDRPNVIPAESKPGSLRDSGKGFPALGAKLWVGETSQVALSNVRLHDT